MNIYKYPLIITDVQRITTFVGAKPLSLMVQNEIPCLWMMVDPTANTKLVSVDMYGTGYELPENPGRHIGSFMVHNGALVFHVFYPGENE